MRVFYSEFQNDYSSYTFSYVPYCVFENFQNHSHVYEKGFLPYTGNPDLTNYLYYMARSLRVNLAEFSLTSENRRVLRRFEDFTVNHEWIPKRDFISYVSEHKKFWMHYCAKRFSGDAMNEERLQYIVESPFATAIIRFTLDDIHAGDVIVSHQDDMLHYWFCFYDLEHFDGLPLGKYLMLQVIRLCHEDEYRFVYLGTCYGDRSLYKARDFRGIEFFDGAGWQNDLNRLKKWCHQDKEESSLDRFKRMDQDRQDELVGKLASYSDLYSEL